MGFKNNDRVLDKISDDEPIFVLRAQDKFAPILIRLWADLAQQYGISEERHNEAIDLVEEMESWPTRKYPD